jgi:Flp pilus assembly protein TadD
MPESFQKPFRALHLVSLCAALGLLTACVTPDQAGVTAVLERPAERALLQGIRAYDDANYAEAEKELQRALGLGLASGKDRASAHKHLAFIHCASQRVAPCEAAFRQARAADPQFELSKAEAGHPLWGPVYRRVLGR